MSVVCPQYNNYINSPELSFCHGCDEAEDKDGENWDLHSDDVVDLLSAITVKVTIMIWTERKKLVNQIQ